MISEQNSISERSTMQAKLDDQLRVLRLAEIDQLAVTLNQKIKTLPEALKHREITIEFETTRDLRIAAETELSDLSGEINRAENDVEQVAKRIERDEARLNAGQGSPKELEQMQHELISLNSRRSELEEIELEVMMRADGIKDRIKDLKSKESELANQLADAATAKDSALSLVQKEIDNAVNSRAELLPQIDKALLDLYEKIRSNGLVGAARLINGNCGGCNLTINAGDLSKLIALPDEEVARCEECRCILVRK
jgi:predicted  nucleic acid-binding Zn-ribbon protein